MRLLKPLLVAAGLALLTAACGSATQSGQSRAAATPTPRPLLNEAADPALGQILTDAQGRTLYHFLPEKDGKVNCTGQCGGIWMPLLVSGTTTPTHDPNVSGTVGTVARPDGTTQVTYYEWPLYTYSGDKKAGETSGQAVAGMWFAQAATAPLDGDNDNDGTPVPTPTPTPAPVAAQPAPQPQAQQPPAQQRQPTPVPVPGFNDGDADNRGGPNDGDGNG
jgi:predicted lipoprotein with Yx(FWY)xxD motif